MQCPHTHVGDDTRRRRKSRAFKKPFGLGGGTACGLPAEASQIQANDCAEPMTKWQAT